MPGIAAPVHDSYIQSYVSSEDTVGFLSVPYAAVEQLSRTHTALRGISYTEDVLRGEFMAALI